MVVALLCRFYGFSDEAVMNFTLRKCAIFLKQMSKIMRLESGVSTTQPRALSGAAAHKFAQQMFGDKK